MGNAIIRRNMSTPEARKFWANVDASAAEVYTWPAWKMAAGLWSVRGYPPTVEEVDRLRSIGEIRKMVMELSRLSADT